VVYLKNEDVTTTLVFRQTSDIKITNLGDGKVRVEGRGRGADEWTKVIVNTEKGTATLESGKLAAPVYTNWEYHPGKTTVEEKTASEVGLKDNQTVRLEYNVKSNSKIGIQR
ncbi:MAG: hypothetical protein ACPLYF_00005, partial [Fervidobacterium sp.]